MVNQKKKLAHALRSGVLLHLGATMYTGFLLGLAIVTENLLALPLMFLTGILILGWRGRGMEIDDAVTRAKYPELHDRSLHQAVIDLDE